MPARTEPALPRTPPLAQSRRPTLRRTLAIRMLLVSASVAAALTVAVFLNYMLRTTDLRRATLNADLQRVVTDLSRGKDPARWRWFHSYPDAYALRVFDHRASYHRKLVTEINPQLLPPLTSTASEFALSEGFDLIPAGQGRPARHRYMLTDHVDIAGNSYWVQLAMVGDPAWRWATVIGKELRADVMLPLLLIIPVLTITMLITTDHALRPLGRIAGQAGALSRAVTEGGPIEALPEAGLPAEIAEVVAAINTMLRNLQHAFSLQQQFAADAAHELRTPLAVLLLQVSRLPPGEARDAILQDLQGLSGLVGQLLRFAQAEDVMARERRMVDVAAVARRVSEELATLAVTRGQMIGFEAPERPAMVLGHDALIDVAIRNVLDNALRHSPPGATINVSVTPLGEVRIDDEGPGVADAQKKRIFERFWRASGQAGGAGIGLALVQRVTRLHGGGARVEDRPGGGARFVLAFGVQAAPRQPVSA